MWVLEMFCCLVVGCSLNDWLVVNYWCLQMLACFNKLRTMSVVQHAACSGSFSMFLAYCYLIKFSNNHSHIICVENVYFEKHKVTRFSVASNLVSCVVN